MLYDIICLESFVGKIRTKFEEEEINDGVLSKSSHIFNFSHSETAKRYSLMHEHTQIISLN